jgi:hypothetical protein
MPTATVTPKLTLAQAAAQWTSATEIIDEQKLLRDQAAKVLLEHFEKTGNPSYKRVGWRMTAASTILDQAKVKDYLGDKLSDFQRKTVPSMVLQLLGSR